MHYYQFEIDQIRHQDMLRKAEYSRLANAAQETSENARWMSTKSKNNPTTSLFDSLLAEIGQQLIDVGRSLNRHSAHIDCELCCEPI